MVTLHTNHGDIVVETFDEQAPVTVQNFLDYCRSGFYDNTIFHRVIKGFMIQGGGFEPGMVQKPTKTPIKNEADNGLKNDRGTLAMARTGDPHSTSNLPVGTAGVIAYSGKLPRAWKCLTKSGRWPRAAPADIRTCQKKMWSSGAQPWPRELTRSSVAKRGLSGGSP